MGSRVNDAMRDHVSEVGDAIAFGDQLLGSLHSGFHVAAPVHLWQGKESHQPGSFSGAHVTAARYIDEE